MDEGGGMGDEKILPPSRVMSIHSSPFSLHPPVWRVFCAIEIPRDVLGRLADHIQLLRRTVPNATASWSRAANIHLTLEFLGDVETKAIDKLSAALSRAAQESSPFRILIGGAGAFPAHGTARVLWIGVHDQSGKLTDLQQHLERECAREGFPKEERAFRPHLTLARLRKPQASRALADTHKQMGFAETELTVSELMLIRSELGNEGSKYTVISRHRLGISDEV